MIRRPPRRHPVAAVAAGATMKKPTVKDAMEIVEQLRSDIAAMTTRIKTLEEAVASIGAEETRKKGLFSWLMSSER
jgi:hypothetical protein